MERDEAVQLQRSPVILAKEPEHYRINNAALGETSLANKGSIYEFSGTAKKQKTRTGFMK